MSDPPTTTAAEPDLVADTPRWRWEQIDDDTPPRWVLAWSDSTELQRHQAFVGERQRLFPYDVRSRDETRLTVKATGATALATMNWCEFGDATVMSLFESLGRWLRAIHDLDAPAGFGDLLMDHSFHTYNAFMAAEFGELSRRMRTLENDAMRDTAVESMAALRQELSAFHPHGKSTWTVGRPTPQRLAVTDDATGVEACLDFGSVALRPPEYDLAALRVYGVLTDHRVADRAFWKGYDVAVTCDLTRRITYFESLIELERLLGCPAVLSE